MYDNKVSLKLHNEIFSAAEEVLDLPLETKMLNTSSKPYYGYLTSIQKPRLDHFLKTWDAPVLEQVSNFTNLIETVHTFAKKVTELYQIVTRMNYGVEMHYDSHIDSMNYLLKVMRYRKPQADENNSVYPRTDKTFITVLHQNHVDGLEIETKNGDWIKVKTAWSNGRLRCPIHRVVTEANDTRYSIGLFGFSQKSVEVPPELVDEEHPLKFKPSISI
ncbi:hypothetical protein MKX03_013272 [Papaver bracteatum]|nr:hypothetical protein MKX03_013272 [Papaver bracteatum]